MQMLDILNDPREVIIYEGEQIQEFVELFQKPFYDIDAEKSVSVDLSKLRSASKIIGRREGKSINWSYEYAKSSR